MMPLELLGDHTCVSSIQMFPTLLQSGFSTAIFQDLAKDFLQLLRMPVLLMMTKPSM
jgi:hypothetical protein